MAARERHVKTKGDVVREARKKIDAERDATRPILASQAQVPWAATEDDARPEELAFRRFLKPDRASVRYMDAPATPEALRKKRELEDVAKANRDLRPPGKEIMKEAHLNAVQYDIQRGRDVIEITAKDEIHLSTFGSPTLHRKRDAPLTPENVEQALAYLEGSPANITSFVAPARSEAVGPFGERPEDALVEGEGDHLELDVERAKAFLDAERDAMQLGRAPRFPSPVYEDHDGDVLDLDVADKKGVGDAPAKGFRYSSFKTQPGRGVVKKNDDQGDVLELSPHSPPQKVPAAVIGREERWTEYSDDDTGLILSPKKVEKHRPGFSLEKAPDRWRVSDEIPEEVIVDHDKVERAKRRAWAAPVPDLAAGGDRFVENSVDEPALQLNPNDSVLSTRGVTSQLGALSFGKRPGRSTAKEEAGPLELDPGERPRDRVQGAADWAREAPRSPLQNVDEGNTLVLEPERGRPAAAPKGHVSMATAPGRHVPTRDPGGDVLTLNVTDPGLKRQDRAVSFASAPNKPKLPKKKKKRPRRQRPRPASAMGRALKALGSVRFF